MKTRLLFFAMFIATGLVTSCSDDDEPEINPLVGEWELDGITVSEPPPSYSNADGQEYSSFHGESRYTLIFNSDLTYTLELEFLDGDIEEEGTWEMNGSDLTLEYENDMGFVTDFKVDGEITNEEMVLLAETQIYALSDEIVNDPMVQDTVDTDEEANALFEAHAQIIDVTAIFEFEKQ